MFYFFTRETSYIRCELRPERDHCDLVILEPGQPERIEQYGSWTAANARWEELQARFRSDGWAGPVGRE